MQELSQNHTVLVEKSLKRQSCAFTFLPRIQFSTMANTSNSADSNAPQLEGGTYEIIRNRLLTQATDLRGRIAKLNDARKEVFGAIEFSLKATDRISTENNCIARDIIAIGDKTLFGYNVHLGLRTETKLSDVFSIYAYSENHFQQLPLDLLQDEKFDEDFRNIYKYYRDTVFLRFTIVGIHLYMVFQIGKNEKDLKAFKWRINPDSSLSYIDARSENETRFPEQHEFKWTRAHRDMQRKGKHPHVSILDRIFVETIGGNLTIKIEDNTDTGQGIYEEEVVHKEQGLDDAEILFANLGNIIVLKIRPFQEREFRYIAFNEKVKEAQRIDALAHSCVLLPEDHGIIFSNGYYLQTGEFKQFEAGISEMHFDKRIQSPNGEDHLYIFYNQPTGTYVLLSYNIISQKVDTPIVCHGYSLFSDGELRFFKTEEEPRKHHAIQIWQTPYTGLDYVLPVTKDNYLFKVGNRDIVKAMAECQEVLTLLQKSDSYGGLYIDLVKITGDITDTHYWLSKSEAFEIDVPLKEIRKNAESAIQEFDKVVRIRKHTQSETQRVLEGAEQLIRESKRSIFENVNQFVNMLAGIRTWRGEATSLKELRYVDAEIVDKLEQTLATESTRLSQACVEYLLREDSLKPYEEKISLHNSEIQNVRTATEAATLEQAIDATGKELELLIEIVSNLKIEDATQTTRIIDQISNIYGELNQVRAALRRQRKALMSTEAIAEFASQLKLVEQAVVNYLDVSDTPEKCEEYLSKLMIQVEEIEGKFSKFDEFIAQVTEKREEIYNAFESRKIQLVEQRNKRASALFKSAERVISGIKNRVASFEEVKQINGYFASDLMIEKVRDLVEQLKALDDTVKAEDIQAKLKVVREDAIRQLKDKQELFVGGENIIQLGKHRFTVNTQALDLTIVAREDAQYFHLTGTNFFELIKNAEFEATRPVWEQALVSENPNVYRAEFLAYHFFLQLVNATQKTAVAQFLQSDQEMQLLQIQQFMTPRYQEGYAKGVHDYDAIAILNALCELHDSIELLRFLPETRACAALWWLAFAEDEQRNILDKRLKGLGYLLQVFPDSIEFGNIIAELCTELGKFCTETNLFPQHLASNAAEYLFHELSRNDQFIASPEADKIATGLLKYLDQKSMREAYASSLDHLKNTRRGRFELLRSWVNAYVRESDIASGKDYVDEAAFLLFIEDQKQVRNVKASVKRNLAGLRGEHAVIGEGGTYALDYNHFMHKLRKYETEILPQYQSFVQLKKELSSQFRHDLRLNEFEPRVLSSFVRNQLIDEVYLPLFGDNLAKQIGAAGENKRTDRQGMLLLISPPGYGKTTLMEYIANRLGLIFVKISGPAIGHEVTSLDPDQANNSAAREEIKKLNLALEMGDNIMLYIDDIQHCNPEFLQKFISLCDAQRKIEGQYKGRAKTYDLRGKRVAVVMAGNPYTESGEKFKIPDMLSNRADTYNLGDIIGDTANQFQLSLIENALSSNASLQKIAQRSHKDIHVFLQIAENGNQEGIDFEANYSPEEVAEIVSVLQKLLIVRDIVLKVNEEYIRSAGIAEEYRTAPAFKLQGSYRDMNKLAEKVVPIMNDKELLSLIVSHYESESQTLTNGAEANLLRFKELTGLMNASDKTRWEEIKTVFMKKQRMLGVDGADRIGQVVASLNELVEAVKDAKKGN